MNAKVFSIALVVLALQALCAQSYGLANLDLADKPNSLEPFLAPGAQPSAQQQRFFDITNIIKALQNILTAINEQIQNASNAVLNAISNAFASAQGAVQNAVDSWNKRLQDTIDGLGVLNETVAECRARRPNLQDVGDELNQDVQLCVHQSSLAAQGALNALTNLGPQAEELILAAEKAVADCEPAGFLFQGACLLTKLPGLVGKGTGLAASAAGLGVKVTTELVGIIPVQSSICVAGAVGNRTLEAFVVIDNFNKCLLESLQATTTPATTSAPADSTSEPADSTSASDSTSEAAESTSAAPAPSSESP